MYGKINNDGSFVKAPNHVKYNSRTYINPSEEIYLACGYLPVQEVNKPLEQYLMDYTKSYKTENGTIIITYTRRESSSSAPVIISDDGDNLIPSRITATKTKTTYNQDETINLDDLEVVCYYKDGTSAVVENYSTNIDDIDSSFMGYKSLDITYIHNSVSVKTSIGLIVNNTDSYNNTQLAYKIAKTGIIKNGLEIISSTDKIRQYGTLKIRIKAKVVVEQNNNSSNTNIGFGEYNVWGTNILAATKVVVKPKQIGVFNIDAKIDSLTYNRNTVASGATILKFYSDGGMKVQGYFEIQDISITYTEAVPKVPVNITASKTQNRAIIGEEMITDDIVVTVTYNDETTSSDVTPQITFPQNIEIGDNTIDVEYSEANHTVSTTLKMHYYQADKTEPDPFTDMTSWEWCRAWHKGINWGNELDSKANSKNTIPGDTSHKGDNYMNQETAWGQPVATLKNFQDIKAKGFDMVRIPVTWCYNSYTEPERDADGLLVRHIGKFWACRVREVVDLALEAGLYVLINMHHEQPIIFTNANSAEMKQCYADAAHCWREIADKFKYYDQRLAFEGYNEVDNLQGSFKYDAEAARQMNNLNQIFVSTVRATGGNNVNRVLHCPTTCHMAQENGIKSWVYPEDDVADHIVLNIHRYAANFVQDLEYNFSMIERYSNKYNVPICIGEWGTNTSSGTWEFRARHAQNFMARAKYHGLFPVFWDNGSDYELVKRYNTKQNYGHTEAQCQLIIDGIMRGYDEMIAYKVPDDQIKTFKNLEDYTLLWWSATKGYYNSYWGSASTYIFPVVGGKKFIIGVDRTGQAVNETVFPAYVNWLRGTENEDGGMDYTVVRSDEFKWHTSDKSGTIPDDANYAIILSNSSDKNVKDWAQILNNGDYCINFISYTDSDIVEEQLAYRKPTNLICTKAQTEYFELGEEIALDDISVSVEYDDGFVRPLSASEYTVDATAVNSSVNGSYYINISATVDGVELTNRIEILIGKLLKSISTNKTLSCKVGTNTADINTSEITLTALYSDDTTVTITEGFVVNLESVDTSIADTYDVTITYSEGDITRTCTTTCLVYDSQLIAEGYQLNSKDIYTYASMTAYGYDSNDAKPNIITISGTARYKYNYYVIDSDDIYVTALKMDDVKNNDTDFDMYVRADVNVKFSQSGANHTLTSKPTSGGAWVGTKTTITDGQGREWLKIHFAEHTGSNVHVYVEASTVPLKYIGGEAELDDIE